MPDTTTGDTEPPFRISNLIFNNGAQVDTSDADIIVLVGPNNTGKTRTLQELQQFLQVAKVDPRTLFVLRDVRVRRAFFGGQLIDWLKQHRLVSKLNTSQGEVVRALAHGHAQGHALPLDEVPAHWRATSDEPWMGNLYAHLVRTLFCGERLQHLGNAQRLDAGAPPNHPIHTLVDNKSVLNAFRNAFAKAFRMNIIIDGLGGFIRFRVSHRLSQSDFSFTTDTGLADPGMAQQINAVSPIETQSDGVTSFTGIALTLLTGQFPLILIDEPEAFLHPPQARLLGQYLAQWRQGGQVFVATHSLDILLGLIEKVPERVLIVRLIRNADITSPHVLPPASLVEISRDPLLHYSRVLDGLFHQAVILCEAERDCTFYAASLDEAARRSELSFSPGDILFVPAGGKDGFPRMVKALKAVSIPTIAIADIDLLNDEGKLRTLVQAMDGDWSSMASSYRIATEAFRQPRQDVTNAQVLNVIKNLLTPISTEKYDYKTKEALRVAMRINPSPWEELKKYGMDAFRGQTRQEAAKVADQLRRLGIVLVEKGTLESLGPSVTSKKGPGWINEALEKEAYRDEPAQTQIARVIDAIEHLIKES